LVKDRYINLVNLWKSVKQAKNSSLCIVHYLLDKSGFALLAWKISIPWVHITRMPTYF
jgi:hypothetical protein